MQRFIDYLIAQLDKATAWIGVLGLILYYLNLHTALILLFILLVILPESQFSEMFKKWTSEIRDIEKKHRQ